MAQWVVGCAGRLSLYLSHAPLAGTASVSEQVPAASESLSSLPTRPPARCASSVRRWRLDVSPNLSTTSSHTFPLSIAPEAQGHAGYYAALRAALADARTKTGDELTQWRDAVGKSELGKETKKAVTDDDDEEEDEDEDEGEEAD